MRNYDPSYFKGKKVLVFGLGLLGGGVATTNWLIKHGARVTITDLKDQYQLMVSLKKIRGKTKLKLNGHDKKDIEENDIIVFNPDIPVNSPFVKYAKELGKQIENEATIFYKLCHTPIIAVTGTRGKTTTANWIGYFLGRAKDLVAVTGNSYSEPLLKTLDQINSFSNSQEFRNKLVVNEIPSYHLEYFTPDIPPPAIAVITNLYQDHLNRHGTMEKYALAKSAVFRNQAVDQNLILNYDNKWTPFFLKQKPRGKVWFFSMKSLPKKNNGVFYKNGSIYFQDTGTAVTVIKLGDFVKKWGSHNLENLLAAVLAAHLAGVPWSRMRQKIKTLPQVPFRQEVVYKNKKLTIINDASATSPEGGIAAINRLASPQTILIAGGTDRELNYKDWAGIVRQKLKVENVVLLAGSATKKMIKLLRRNPAETFDTLGDCLRVALKRASKYPKSVVLFSPAAKSFEKFKNEFDRGRQFNKLAKKLTRRKT